LAIPILSRRTERKQAALSAAVEAGVEKAMSRDIVAAAANSQGRAVSGATYIPNPSSPFAQTAGQVPGYVPLPRPLGDFNSGFGPGVPLFPDAIDALGPAGRAMPRRAQYLVAANLQLMDRALPWTALKWIAEECDVVNRCIQLVQDGICGRNWSWGYSDSLVEQIMNESGEQNHARAMALAADKYGTELDRVKSFFERPDQRSKHSFSQWLAEIIWQSLVYDGICVYPQRTLGGDLFALAPIDTSTIKILLDNQGFPPEPPAPAFQQILYGFPRGEFQAGDGPVEGEFASDQLAYYKRRPRPESVYGYPPTEEVMTVATTYLQRQAWMRSEYVYGMSPRTYYKMDKDNPTGWTPEQQFGYEDTMNNRLSGQINRRQQAFLLPPGIEPMWPPQIDEHYKSDYDNFLIIQMGSKFGVPATQLGVQAKAGLSGGRQMEGEEDQTEHFVTEAFVNFLIDVQNDLARRYLGIGREITATCQDTGGSEQDILQQANADTQTVNNGRITLNDWRAKNGLPLYSMPEADEPFIAGAQGPVFLKGTLAVQDANTEATLNPPEPPKQVFVGPDGKPLPTAPDGSPVPPPAANNGGTDANANGSTPDDNGGRKPTGSAAGGTSTDSDGNTELTGSSPSKGSASDSKSESDTDAEKELKSFVKFAKARIDRGSWRDFSFSAVASVQGRHLNDLGRAGDLDAIKSVVNAQPDAAGIIVLAADTGRVLMVQRVNDDHLAPGTWEWPGGQCHKGEDAFSGATREWQAEVGLPLPQGDITGSWLTPDGTYQAFVLQIKHESDIDLDDVTDRDTSEIAAAAWWEPSDIVGNSAVRVEVQSTDWSLLGAVKSVQAYDLNPRSGMISLDVPDGVITPLSGGITDFHLTVVYLGPDVDDKSFAEACDAARKAAKDAPGPLTGTISGIASFAPSASSDGLKPVYVVPNIAGITDLREALEDLSASEHDFMPHITLAYLDPDDPLPKPLPLTPLTFDYLSVHRGDEVVRFALGGDKANKAVKADPKGNAQATGLTTRNIDALRDAIVAHYAPLLTAALKHSTKGLHQAIDEAQRKTAAKAVADAGGGADDQGIAQSAAAMNVTVAQSSAAQILRDLIAESYAVGSHAAAQQISPDAQMAIGTALSWDDWVPGSIQAADLVANGGLQQLLERAGITIKSAIDNGIDRVGNVLADGLARGDTIETITGALQDAVSANAQMIAVTETCRAFATADQDTYAANGIEQWRWIPSDGSCDVCLEYADESADTPYDVGDGPDQPAHPNCSCTSVGVTGYES
jgi:8-oxo-dGTP pyrophosphatase MutT (NUDIX family)/2'-5' RNA ligase